MMVMGGGSWVNGGVLDRTVGGVVEDVKGVGIWRLGSVYGVK